MLDSDLRTGAVLDERFILERQIGAGGCGVVWLARDGEGSQEDVVLKILHPYFDRFSIAVRQLEREADVLGQLEHPNISKPYFFSSGGAHTYLAMQYIEGRSLDQELAARTKLSFHFTTDELSSLFEELCAAVGHAHARGIIHRDLKPQNLMVQPTERSLGVKVLDFGIAKLLDGDAVDETTNGRRVGTVFYMSPEQIRGVPADARSDIFALGSILFEVLTLRRAWAWDPQDRPLRAFEAPIPADGHNTPPGVLVRIAMAPRPRPTASRKDLPPIADEILIKAMALDPADRHQTVEEFLADVRRLVTAMRAREELARIDRSALDPDGVQTMLTGMPRRSIPRSASATETLRLESKLRHELAGPAAIRTVSRADAGSRTVWGDLVPEGSVAQPAPARARSADERPGFVPSGFPKSLALPAVTVHDLSAENVPKLREIVELRKPGPRRIEEVYVRPVDEEMDESVNRSWIVVVGILGMLTAFVVGVALARLAAEAAMVSGF